MRLSEPSERNFLVFNAVEFERRSLRSVAEEHRISVGRVQQIVAEMRAWYVATTPEWVGATPLALQPLVAARMFDERLSHLSREVQQAWEDSKGLVSVTRKSATSSSGQTTTTQSAGRPRYLLALARLAKMQYEGALRLSAWRLAHPDAEPLLAAAVSETKIPYAREDQETTGEDRTADNVPLVTTDEDTTYVNAEECSEPIFSPQTSAPTPMRARKERRRRERELRRALAKKAK
jgi:hypothetical protein